MQVAGPVQSGDMVVRSNQASPGITALLAKESRKQRGIFQLPPTEEPQKDFYNMALDNVQNQLRGAAQTVNAMAPQGESLAYINPQEANILKMMGGSGEPEPVTGIPSFYITDGKEGSGVSKGMIQGAKNLRKAKERTKNIREAMKNFKPSKGPKPDTGDKPYIPMVAGGIGGDEFKDDKNIDDNYAQQALINAYVAGANRQAKGEKVDNVGQDALRGLAALRGQANKTLFSSDYNKMLNRAMQYGDPLTTGNFYLGSSDNDLRKKGIFGDYDTEEAKRLKYALGGGASKAGDFMSNFGIGGLLNNLFGNDDATFEDRLKMYDNMKAKQDRINRGGGGSDDQNTGVDEEDDTDTEEEDEDEFDYFSYRRRLMQPMDYESIIARAYEGSDGSLLQNLGEAIKERDEA